MELHKQVVSLEKAKRLKELGFKQESLFYWDDSNMLIASYQWADVIENEPSDWQVLKESYFSAYTVAELGEMLPFGFSSFQRHDEKWICRNQRLDRGEHGDVSVLGETEADTRASMLIYLAKEKLIEPKTI